MVDETDEAATNRAESWRTGGWTGVLHAFALAPDEASDDLRTAATAIMDSVARALEAWMMNVLMRFLGEPRCPDDACDGWLLRGVLAVVAGRS